MKKSNGFMKNYSLEICSVLLFLLATVLSLFINVKAGIFVALLFIIYLVFLAFYFQKNARRKEKLALSNTFSPVLCKLLNELDSPVMITSDSNRIVWSNNEFGSLDEVRTKHLSSGTASLFGGQLSYSTLMNSYEKCEDYIFIKIDERNYGVRVFPLEFDRSVLYGAVFYDREDIEKMKNLIFDHSVRVAYIVVDNSSEISQDADKSTRFGSAAVNELLKAWADSYDAILIEYERDRYIMQFENKHLDDMVKKEFDIISKVGQLSDKEYEEKITISIGVSTNVGTLEEKRISANEALRLALQRGGAVAVVKTENGEDIYGGLTKSVQRQTKIKSRLCRDLLLEKIPHSKNVIIMGHSHPDYDSIASNIGISILVRYLGGTPYIITDRNDENISRAFTMLEKYKEYDNIFIDGQYAQEIMSSKESLLIVTDASSSDTFAQRDIFDNCENIIIIDHHASKEDFSKKVLPRSIIDPTASSASELVCEILELSLRPEFIRPEEAQILLNGILLDTQFFTHDTGTRTYAACMFLKSAGSDIAKSKEFFKTDYDQFLAVSNIQQNMQVYRNRFAISYFLDSDDETAKVTAAKAANNMINVNGISASFVVYTQKAGMALSARSDGEFNVRKVAELMGGGGHFQAAGAIIKDGKEGPAVFDFKEAMKILKDAIDVCDRSNDDTQSSEEDIQEEK